MNFLAKNAQKFSPNFLSLFSLCVWKNPAKFPPNLPPQKSKKNHRRASARAQGEIFCLLVVACSSEYIRKEVPRIRELGSEEDSGRVGERKRGHVACASASPRYDEPTLHARAHGCRRGGRTWKSSLIRKLELFRVYSGRKKTA